MHTYPNLPSFIVIALAVAVYGVLQLAKRFTPGLCGRYAVAVNFLLSAIGVILATAPEHIMEPHTVFAVLTVAAGAAGFHGTASKLGTEDAPATTSALAAALLLLCIFPMTGCKVVKAAPAAPLPATAADNIDFTSNQVLQAAHGFAAHVSADVLDGKLKLSADQRTALGRLNATLNVADALEIGYHRCAEVRNAQPSNPACDATSLTATVTAVQQYFGQAELALAPTASK